MKRDELLGRGTDREQIIEMRALLAELAQRADEVVSIYSQYDPRPVGALKRAARDATKYLNRNPGKPR